MVSEELEIAIEEWLGERKAGEWELKRCLRKQGYKITDVSNNPDYWYRDIDLINTTTGESIEVKWDGCMSKTKNLFIEICSNIDTNADGWYLFCEADFLYYGDSRKELFYIFDFQRLKQHIEEHKADYEIKKAPDYNRYGNIKKWSKGYIVPLESLEGLYKTLSVRGQY